MALVARDIMQPRVVTTGPSTPLAELSDLLISKRIGGVPVIERGVVVGIVSRSDLVRAFSLDRSIAGVVAEGAEQEEFAPAEVPDLGMLPQHLTKQLEGRTVRDVMTRDPVSVSPDTSVREVATLLVSRHLHRVLVTEGKRLCGVISALDVVRSVADGRLREP
jgi:CBS domain-containing protein